MVEPPSLPLNSISISAIAENNVTDVFESLPISSTAVPASLNRQLPESASRIISPATSIVRSPLVPVSSFEFTPSWYINNELESAAFLICRPLEIESDAWEICNSELGELVPIPTRPLLLMRMRSVGVKVASSLPPASLNHMCCAPELFPSC